MKNGENAVCLLCNDENWSVTWFYQLRKRERGTTRDIYFGRFGFWRLALNAYYRDNSYRTYVSNISVRVGVLVRMRKHVPFAV